MQTHQVGKVKVELSNMSIICNRYVKHLPLFFIPKLMVCFILELWSDGSSVFPHLIIFCHVPRSEQLIWPSFLLVVVTNQNYGQSYENKTQLVINWKYHLGWNAPCLNNYVWSPAHKSHLSPDAETISRPHSRWSPSDEESEHLQSTTLCPTGENLVYSFWFVWTG